MSDSRIDCWACGKKIEHGQAMCSCKALNKNLTPAQMDYVIYGRGTWLNPFRLRDEDQDGLRWENGKMYIVINGKKELYKPKLHGPGGLNSLRRSG